MDAGHRQTPVTVVGCDIFGLAQRLTSGAKTVVGLRSPFLVLFLSKVDNLRSHSGSDNFRRTQPLLVPVPDTHAG